jgi:hypothetical protein
MIFVAKLQVNNLLLLNPHNHQIPRTMLILKHRFHPRMFHLILLLQPQPAIRHNHRFHDTCAERHEAPHDTEFLFLVRILRLVIADVVVRQGVHFLLDERRRDCAETVCAGEFSDSGADVGYEVVVRELAQRADGKRRACAVGRETGSAAVGWRPVDVGCMSVGRNSRARHAGCIDGRAHDAAVEEDALEQGAVEVPCEEEFAVLLAPVEGGLDGHHAGCDVEADTFWLIMFG